MQIQLLQNLRAAIFVVSITLQKRFAFNNYLFQNKITAFIGVFFLTIAFIFIVTSLYQFIRSKNSIITIRSATSLQKTGIYQITRNPMYLALFMVYLGLTCLLGNWWNLILLPLLLVMIQKYVVKNEEKYLEREFGQEFIDYKLKVRRWL